MVLYNTLTRKKEEFVPLEGTVRIYSCGPTVYNTATIGNLRAYIFTDILKKTLELGGFNIFDVMNITDVGHLVTDADEGEDKVEAAARRGNTTPSEIAARYTKQFFDDCDKLNIRKPKIIAPATQYIDEMMKFIRGLENKGFTYKTSDGIYFDSSKFADYSKLSRTPIEQNRAGARVDLGEKRNAHDFALWKFVGDTTIQKWPFEGRDGCPGWHIECSTIALKHLGETFDIHTGGIDHIPTHHSNEIAQTESLTGKTMCRFWLHNEFITINGGKMSKSLGNAYTLSDIEKQGFLPMAFRYFVLTANYRTILNFSWAGLQSAQNAYKNLLAQLGKHYQATTKTPQQKVEEYFKSFTESMTDDLNTPKALAVIQRAIKEPYSKDIYELIIKMDKTLSLNLHEAAAMPTTESFPCNATELAEQRLRAKKQKNYELADELRKKINALGFNIEDTKDGFKLSKKTDC